MTIRPHRNSLISCPSVLPINYVSTISLLVALNHVLFLSDEPIRLQREVVLLTDDRNLRLKAHTRNVPVKNAPAFLKWAKLG